MARYDSDSDDDRRSRHRHSRSSRRRDRRSRSRSRSRDRDRDRRRRSRSREDERRRRRSRSRSSERNYKSSRSSKKGSRSGSRNTSDSESRKDNREKREKSGSSGTSSQTSKEKTKQSMKEALQAVESKDEELKMEKEKKDRAKLVPDAETILQIENNSFHAQSFSSSSGSKHRPKGKSDAVTSDQDHEHAIFGNRTTVGQMGTTTLPSDKPITATVTMPVTVDKESLLALCLHEDEHTKNARWVEKLKKLRQRFLSAT